MHQTEKYQSYKILSEQINSLQIENSNLCQELEDLNVLAAQLLEEKKNTLKIKTE